MMIEILLLVGFVIAATTSVFFWAKSRAEVDTKNVAYSIGASIQCADIKIEAVCNPPGIKNTGYHTLNKIINRDLAAENQEKVDITNGLAPGGTWSTGINNGNEVIPMVEEEGKLYLCKEKAIVVKCEQT